MLTVIAEIRTRPGQHHRQAVLDQFAKNCPCGTAGRGLPRLRAAG